MCGVFTRVSVAAMVVLAFDAPAQLICDTGFAVVTQELKVAEHASDLEPLVVYEDGREIVLATGGEGPLTAIINSWLWERDGQYVEQVNTLDFRWLSFDRSDTPAEVVRYDADGRVVLRFCLPDGTRSTTTHAIYGDITTVGIQSTVGHVRDGRIDAVANRATGAWFHRFNQGRERSGSEQLLRIMKHHFGATPSRSVAARQVIALNEMYTAALASEQLPGGNDLNVDVEGNTVYVEGAPTRMCFSDSTMGFWVDGVDRLVNHCVTGLERLVGKRYVALTGTLAKTGTIENAQLGYLFVSHDCVDGNGRASVSFGEAPLNVRTIFRQDGHETVVDGHNPHFVGTCGTLTVTAMVLGNHEQPLYKRSMDVWIAPTEGS